MGQLVEGCGIPLEDWLPHHKMAAINTTFPRMQRGPPRCRCLRHLIEGALKSGGACCASEPRAHGAPGEAFGETQPEGGRIAPRLEGAGRTRLSQESNQKLCLLFNPEGRGTRTFCVGLLCCVSRTYLCLCLSLWKKYLSCTFIS